MASRMDRYYKTELVTKERSLKNKDIYNQINDLDSYSNIEGVANIENSNEIDISKVREMLKRRDEYKSKKRAEIFAQEESPQETLDEIKSYDINSVLSKVRENSSKEKYRSLDDDQYEELKNIKKKQKTFDIDKEEAEIKELIQTLHAFKLKEAATQSLQNTDDVGLLDELKSNTMVGDATSIKNIIQEEKKNYSDDKDEIDNSFYTKSFGFTSDDFEELRDINQKIKKGNKFIIILLIALILLIGAILGMVFLPKILP